jgi:hypothetical protein
MRFEDSGKPVPAVRMNRTKPSRAPPVFYANLEVHFKQTWAKPGLRQIWPDGAKLARWRRSKGWLGAAFASQRPLAIVHCFAMAEPCRKCGETKTESIPHGLRYSIARIVGYRLRMCSRCRRLRLLPRHAEGVAYAASKPAAKRKTRPREPGVCPRCGSNDYRRSRRRFLERLIRRPPMARCRVCRKRFPLPRP